jgi:hypothetical protein
MDAFGIGFVVIVFASLVQAAYRKHKRGSRRDESFTLPKSNSKFEDDLSLASGNQHWDPSSPYYRDHD